MYRHNQPINGSHSNRYNQNPGDVPPVRCTLRTCLRVYFLPIFRVCFLSSYYEVEKHTCAPMCSHRVFLVVFYVLSGLGSGSPGAQPRQSWYLVPPLPPPQGIGTGENIVSYTHTITEQNLVRRKVIWVKRYLHIICRQVMASSGEILSDNIQVLTRTISSGIIKHFKL